MKDYCITRRIHHSYTEIKDTHKSLFKGCKTVGAFLKRHSIPDNMVTYARLEKDTDDEVWEVSDGTSKRFDKLFIRRTFCRNHLFPAVVTHATLPDEIELDDEECFHDEDDNVLAIRVYGEREHDAIVFSAKDVAEVFDMPSLEKNVCDKNGGYVEDVHYRRLIVPHPGNRQKSDKIGTYLTFDGVLKVLYGSYGAKTAPFLSWASKILFAAKMGTPEQKQRLGAKLTGLKYEMIKNVCKATSGDTPCIYLFTLGTVKQLRKSMSLGPEYKDADYVYKYGRTNKLDVRAGQHEATFKKVKGSDLKLVYYAYIDVRYCSDAEGMIRDMMTDMDAHIEYGSAKELVIIPKKKVKRVLKEYDAASMMYRGCLSDVIAENQSLRKDILLLATQHQTAIAHHQTELQAANHRADLLEKDLEMSTYKCKAYKRKLIKLKAAK